VNWTTHPESVEIGWLNNGKEPVRRGTAALFTLGEGADKGKPLGQADIKGAGSSVLPGYNGSSMFSFDMSNFLGLFLVCTVFLMQTEPNMSKHSCSKEQQGLDPNRGLC
jgi:hypothetical protein